MNKTIAMVLRIISGIGLLLEGILLGGAGGFLSILGLLFGQGTASGLIPVLFGIFTLVIGVLSIIRGIRNAGLPAYEGQGYRTSEQRLSICSAVGVLFLLFASLFYEEFNISAMIANDGGFILVWCGVLLVINIVLYLNAAKQG